jgi:hypothetical protein
VVEARTLKENAAFACARRTDLVRVGSADRTDPAELNEEGVVRSDGEVEEGDAIGKGEEGEESERLLAGIELGIADDGLFDEKYFSCVDLARRNESFSLTRNASEVEGGSRDGVFSRGFDATRGRAGSVS